MRSRRRSRRVAVATLAVSLLLGAGSVVRAGSHETPGVAEGTTVRFATDDGLTIAATWWPGDGPGTAILLPMYGGARTSWRSLVPALRDRGLAVLAIDPRGHGESAVQGDVDLSLRVKGRDATLFAETWRDVAGATRWLVDERAREPKRIGLIGASVGASVAIDAARRRPTEVGAVLALTPGPRYLGLDSVAQAQALRADLPVAFVTHRDEDAGVTRPVWEALGARKAPEGTTAAPPLLRVLAIEPPPGAVSSKTLFHGIRLLGAAPLLEDWIADWASVALGVVPEAPLLDGDVADEMRLAPAEATGDRADRGGVWSRAPAVSGPDGVAVRALLQGTRRIVFGGTLPEGATRWRILLHVRRGDPRRESGHAWGNLDATLALREGVMTDGTTDASSVEGWPEPPVVVVTGAVRDGVRPFEGVVHLPTLTAGGVVQAWMTVGVGDGPATRWGGGVARGDPSTWVEITKP